MKKLAARSDVLIENFKVGGLAKFGLDYESLAADNPRLIYCSVTGFGQNGPYASRAGYDLMAQGMGGFMSLTGTADGEPTRAGVPVSDIFTGVYSVVGILAALARREKTGRGTLVDTALVDTRSACSPTRRSTISSPATCRSASATRIPTSCPTRCSRSPTATSSSPPATTASIEKLCGVLGEPELAQQAGLHRQRRTGSPIATS